MVLTEEETVKILSLYEASLEVCKNRHIPCEEEHIKSVGFLSARLKCSKKFTTSEINLLYYAAYIVMSLCEIDL
jgi:hypothetical protein